MASWYWEPEFRTIELDRDSRIPDELYPSCVEPGPLDSPESENGARAACAPPGSTEDVELPHYGRDPFGRPDPRTHPEAWCE